MENKLIALFREDGTFEMVISVKGHDEGFRKILDSAAAGYPYSGKSFKEVLTAEAAEAGYQVDFPACETVVC